MEKTNILDQPNTVFEAAINFLNGFESSGNNTNDTTADSVLANKLRTVLRSINNERVIYPIIVMIVSTFLAFLNLINKGKSKFYTIIYMIIYILLILFTFAIMKYKVI